MPTAEAFLEGFLERLPEQHQRALRWYAERAETVQPWPGRLDEQTLLATKAKGIYKPKWSEYALSVRETLADRYPDREPKYRDDGTWYYLYYQESHDPTDLEKEYTNRGLLACARDHVPVGVMRQVRGKPNVRYMILGVALVKGWKDGYFELEGFSPEGHLHSPGAGSADGS